MRSPSTRFAALVAALIVGGCSTAGPIATGSAAAPATTSNAEVSTPQPTAAPTPTVAAPSPLAVPAAVTLVFDTDVAGDDLVALAFLLESPNVTVAGITVSGTGEAHCHGGVDVVLRVLTRLGAPDIPVACGREAPLKGQHAFPDAWRRHVDDGSGLLLPDTFRAAQKATAAELISSLSKQHKNLHILATGPLTNFADALLADPQLPARLGGVTIMGGALHVPGNLVCCGAPEDNHVAEWNIYVDPHAAQVVVESGVGPAFVSLDGTNQVPVTTAFAARVAEPSQSLARRLIADLFAANPFMGDGSYYLWDPLAAEMAAGYPIGAFAPAAITVEEAEGPESGFTRPTTGEPNVRYLSTVDAKAAEDTLLFVLNGG